MFAPIDISRCHLEFSAPYHGCSVSSTPDPGSVSLSNSYRHMLILHAAPHSISPPILPPPPPSPKHKIIPPPTPTPPIFPLHIHSQTPSFSTKSNNPLPRPYQSPISDSISSPSPDLLSSPNSKHTLSSPLHSLALFLFLHSYPHHHAPHQLPSYHPTSARRSPALAHTPNLSCTSTAASNLTLPGFLT